MKHIHLILLLILVFVATITGTGIAATLSWTGVTSYTDGSAIPSGKTITYNVKSGATSTGSFSTEGTTTSTSRTITAPASGVTRYYTVSATVDGKESANATPIPYTTPLKTPAAPGGLKIVP